MSCPTIIAVIFDYSTFMGPVSFKIQAQAQLQNKSFGFIINENRQKSSIKAISNTYVLVLFTKGG